MDDFHYCRDCRHNRPDFLFRFDRTLDTCAVGGDNAERAIGRRPTCEVVRRHRQKNTPTCSMYEPKGGAR